MKAYQLTADGPAYRLEKVERPSPKPGPGQVVVRVHSTSLNYRDLINLKKLAGRKLDGIIPLSDGAGEVAAVGAGVTRWEPGERVAATFFQKWVSGRFQLAYHTSDLGGSIDGMLAEEVLLHEDGLVRLPDYLTYDEAACLPCAGVTAWYSLVKRGNFQAGEWVLVQGTGGVSIFALQFAVARGGTVVVTSSSDDKLARARQLGATHTINYKSTADWDKEVWKITNKRGVDHVIEVGGPGTLEKSMNSVAPEGYIALIGVLTGFGPTQASLFPLLARNVRVNGIYVGSRADFEDMNRFLEEKKLRPVVDRDFPFDAAAEAYRYLESGSHFGKVVVRVR